MGFGLPQKDKYLSTTCKINKRATYARWENCNAKTVPDSLIFHSYLTQMCRFDLHTISSGNSEN